MFDQTLIIRVLIIAFGTQWIVKVPTFSSAWLHHKPISTHQVVVQVLRFQDIAQITVTGQGFDLVLSIR